MSSRDNQVIYEIMSHQVWHLIKKPHNDIRCVKPAAVLTNTHTHHKRSSLRLVNFQISLHYSTKTLTEHPRVLREQQPAPQEEVRQIFLCLFCSLFHPQWENTIEDSRWAEFNWLRFLSSRDSACAVFTQPPRTGITGAVSQDGMQFVVR